MSLANKSFSLFKRDGFLFVTNLATGIIVARTLGPAALGIWVILQLVPSYAEAFGRMKFDIAAVYFLGKKRYAVGDVVFTLNFLAILTSALILTPIIWKFDWIYRLLFSQTDYNARMLMAVMLVQIPLHFLNMNYNYLYIHREDVKTYNRMLMLKSVISSVVGIVLLLVFKMGLLSVVIAALLSLLGALLYGVSKFGALERTGPRINVPLMRDLFSYGYKVYLTGIIGHLNVYITRLLVVFYIPPSAVAYFGMAQNQGQLMNKIPDALNTLLFPRVAKSGEDEAAELIARSFRIILFLLLIVGLLAMVFIKPLVTLLYGSAYVPLVNPFRILLPGIILSGAATVIDQYFSGIGRADLGMKISLIPLIMQGTLALVLLPLSGLRGAAMALSISMVCTAMIQIYVFLRISGLSFRNDLVIRRADIHTVIRFIRSDVLSRFGFRSSARNKEVAL